MLGACLRKDRSYERGLSFRGSFSRVTWPIFTLFLRTMFLQKVQQKTETCRHLWNCGYVLENSPFCYDNTKDVYLKWSFSKSSCDIFSIKLCFIQVIYS